MMLLFCVGMDYYYTDIYVALQLRTAAMNQAENIGTGTGTGTDSCRFSNPLKYHFRSPHHPFVRVIYKSFGHSDIST